MTASSFLSLPGLPLLLVLYNALTALNNEYSCDLVAYANLQGETTADEIDITSIIGENQLASMRENRTMVFTLKPSDHPDWDELYGARMFASWIYLGGAVITKNNLDVITMS